MSWCPPPRTGCLGQRCAGRALGGAVRALGGRRRPVKVTDSRERWPGGPSSGGNRPGGRRRRANEDDRSCQDGVYGRLVQPIDSDDDGMEDTSSSESEEDTDPAPSVALSPCPVCLGNKGGAGYRAERNKMKKVKTVCSACGRHACEQHSSTVRRCDKCQLDSGSE